MISIIGAGKWGQALKQAFEDAGNRVLISSRSPRQIADFCKLDEALKSEYLVFAISAQAIRPWLETNAKNGELNGKKILVAAKGIDVATGKFLNEIFEEYSSNIAYLSGPSFASEVMLRLPCAVVVSSKIKDLRDDFTRFFPSYIKVYSEDDIIGAEICGAYKNVIAIASGICDGLNLGNNARASLIARGLVEIARFGKVFGARDETFLGLSGAGDLFLTASSNLSRNYRVGFALACGKSLDEILAELGEVAEGVATSKAIVKISNSMQIYTPIATEVSLIIDGKNAKNSLKDLLKKK
ncbi:MAG: NAD(P)H-dependent glycerol-3-phosphate dehydrogenase [Campylobacter sp.]|nr:NAD(P)H-dependent glycerol-3-phosphate dehydrogenase [Campylobacter sp.]